MVQGIVALLFIGGMMQKIDTLSVSIGEMKNDMVHKETVDLQMQGIRAELSSIRESQAQTNKRVESMEERQLNGRSR